MQQTRKSLNQMSDEERKAYLQNLLSKDAYETKKINIPAKERARAPLEAVRE